MIPRLGEGEDAWISNLLSLCHRETGEYTIMHILSPFSVHIRKKGFSSHIYCVSPWMMATLTAQHKLNERHTAATEGSDL